MGVSLLGHSVCCACIHILNAHEPEQRAIPSVSLVSGIKERCHPGLHPNILVEAKGKERGGGGGGLGPFVANNSVDQASKTVWAIQDDSRGRDEVGKESRAVSLTCL